MKVLVTGGSGRIGTDLIQSLDQKGFEVTVFDLEKPRACKFIRGNLLNLSTVKEATRDFDTVMNFIP